MSLLSDYQARYSLENRVGASNPQLSSEATVDSTRETNAAADAQADFEAICGETYSSSKPIHVSAAVPLVFAKLLVYTAQADQAAYDKFLKRLEDWYKLVLGRNRIAPTTDSPLVPTLEPANSKPMSDLSNFDKFLGNSPSGSSSGTETGRRID